MAIDIAFGGSFFAGVQGKSLGLDAQLSRAPFGPFAGDNPIARAYLDWREGFV